MNLPTAPLRVSLVQGSTRWHDAAGNREYYGGLVRTLAGQGDLVVLPETFLSGFTNETLGNAETMDGEGLRWLRGLAAEVGAVVTGSLVVREGDKCVNRLVWMCPDGSHACYDKRHLFRMAGEHERYTGGSERLVVDINGWRICPQVCYDLRFPVWLRNRWSREAQRFDYDLLVFVANWPSPRRYAWSTLLRARAIENLSYCVGVNRVGSDGNGHAYSGDSAVLDFLGQPLVELGAQEQVVTVSLDPQALAAHRERFPAWMDADAFTILD
ncbi:MAG TPA: amidohydrolase [Dokdonella sp.]|uniref:amidohydrolase n=1 Tax=Dokdonella sp. TaxID=2291710 RepID=UPI0025BE404B|nr:amidohydrolase [Dokdonella sp.]MBX3693094.1 amidohydrolase [Dokdonella sp.]MCW5567838.1 amidohydrolase [Dokdonella sp.]HNR91375.1 amidohydrolase [Dokdonella sp.]